MAEMAGFSNHQHVCPIPMKGLDCTPSFQNAALAPAGIQLFRELFFSADFSFLHSCQTPGAITIYSPVTGWVSANPHRCTSWNNPENSHVVSQVDGMLH